jgi:hypothetical protein
MTDLSSSRRPADPRTRLRGTEHPSSGLLVEVADTAWGLDVLPGHTAARAVGVVLAAPARGGRR